MLFLRGKTFASWGEVQLLEGGDSNLEEPEAGLPGQRVVLPGREGSGVRDSASCFANLHTGVENNSSVINLTMLGNPALY